MDRMIDSKVVIEKILGMSWYTAEFANAPFSFLTSDRPFVMTNGFARENAHIAIPISPTRLFLAVNSAKVFHEIRSTRPRDLIQIVNHRIAESSVRYVYGVDDSQLRFVARRLGKAVPSSPLG